MYVLFSFKDPETDVATYCVEYDIVKGLVKTPTWAVLYAAVYFVFELEKPPIGGPCAVMRLGRDLSSVTTFIEKPEGEHILAVSVSGY